MKPRLLTLATLSLALGGCTWMWHDLYDRSERQSSTPLVSFLYTDGKVPELDAQPVLRLPIRVGISFLPRDTGPNSFQPGAIDREKVLTAVREHFRSLPYISEIVIVPDYYLHAGKGDGLMQLEQLSRLYHFDLFALVSYDQVRISTDRASSFFYLTIVGGYVVKGDRNSTHTLLDLAVIDPKSRALVMRAGGTSALSANATAVDADRHASDQSVKGFELATGELIGNFSRELTGFEERVRDGTAPIKVVRQGAKSGGSGGLDLSLLVFLMATLALAKIRRYWDSRVARKVIFGQRSIVSSRFTREGARYTNAPE